MRELMDYGERRMRLAIEAAPDGIYAGEDRIDDDGVGEEPVVVRATVVIANDSLSVDFTGTGPPFQSRVRL